MFDARFEAIDRQLHQIEGMLKHFFPLIHRNLEIIMSSLEVLQQQVAQSNTVMDSAGQLIAGLLTKLQAAIDAAKAGDNHVALDQLASDLASHSTALAAAVQANTDAAPPAPAAPVEAPAPAPEAPAPVDSTPAPPDATPAPSPAPEPDAAAPENNAVVPPPAQP